MAGFRSTRKHFLRRSGAWLVLPLSLITYGLLRSSLKQIRQNQVDCESAEKKQTVDLLSNKPGIVWLTSFPNSGTSYTMTMVERATNLSTATNYGKEVAREQQDAIPVFPEHPEGPFWDGLSGTIGTIRYLPDNYIMTKTHCGGRCVKCPASEYVTNSTDFLRACEKTSGFFAGQRFESRSKSPVAKVIHLIRNPLTNVIARFHLEQRHMAQHDPATAFSRDAEGFAAWCRMLDDQYSNDDAEHFTPEQLQLMEQTPCHAEFFKYVQWHNILLELIDAHQWPVLTIHYEDYAYDQLEETATRLFRFLEQTPVEALKSFRDLPSYSDHVSLQERVALHALVQNVASPATWELLQRYFEDSAST